jgi:hypothetical protein
VNFQIGSPWRMRIYLSGLWWDSSALTESDTRQSHQTSIVENPLLAAVFLLYVAPITSKKSF